MSLQPNKEEVAGYRNGVLVVFRIYISECFPIFRVKKKNKKTKRGSRSSLAGIRFAEIYQQHLKGIFQNTDLCPPPKFVFPSKREFVRIMQNTNMDGMERYRLGSWEVTESKET